MGCPTQHFDAISVDLYNALRVQATAAGAVFDGNTVHFKGCQFTWDYYPATLRLDITCDHHPPFVVDCAYVAEKISDLIAQARQGATQI